jgi:micrococcal nuclease
MKKTISRAAAIVAAAMLCIGTLSACAEGTVLVPGSPSDPVPTSASVEPSSTTPDRPRSVEAEVIRVVDGDTVAVTPVPGVLEPTGEHDGVPEHTVRILGVDAPEMNYRKDAEPECGAQTATNHLGGILPQGLPVVIEYDATADRMDRYGRSLAYVTTRGGTDAGLKQVADGYAMPWYPKSEPEPERVAEYRMAADTAVDQRAGAHSQCPAIGRG